MCVGCIRISYQHESGVIVRKVVGGREEDGMKHNIRMPDKGKLFESPIVSLCKSALDCQRKRI